MDYEKYNEALERARKVLRECNSPNCGEKERSIAMDIATYIFPELKENEDEKIRKEIIQFVQARLAGFPECERFVTWLEKQGEQKPVWSEEDENFFNDTIAFFERTTTLDHRDWLKSLKQRIENKV